MKKHFLALVTVQYGEYEAMTRALVEAESEQEANLILSTVIEADNLGQDFSWFGHGTDEVGVHDRFSLERIKASEAKVLNKVGCIQYVNSAYKDAQRAIKGSEN